MTARVLVATLIGCVLFPPAAQAQSSVTGAVYDSLARRPLPDAVIQLIAAENPASLARTTTTDKDGRFTLAGVPEGRYLIGFLHPMLDSLGIEPPPREVVVEAKKSPRVELFIPSPSRIRTALCGANAERDSIGVIIGSVREAREEAPINGATVSGDWIEYSFGREGFSRRSPRRVVTTGENGWFALCGVPINGTVALFAWRGADSTGLIEIQVPANGFARSELFLGESQFAALVDTTKFADTLAARSRRIRVGDARLTGTVVAAVGGKPLGGAIVAISDGPETRANDRGEWTISNAPLGTRALEVRAIGYYPERKQVDVRPNSKSIKVSLATMKSVLATVQVRAARLYDQNLAGFARRRRSSGAGHFIDAAEIARHPALETSDIFRRIPGLRVEYTQFGETILTMRDRVMGRCRPSIYIDDHYMRDLSADEIDGWVRPKNVLGIEVYPEGTVPPQFDMGPLLNVTDAGTTMNVSSCGAIVIWTKYDR